MGDLGVIGAWLLLGIVVIGAVLTAMAIVWLANRIISRDARQEHNSILSPFLTVVGLVVGALVSFTVVVGWQQYLSAEVNVSNEASTLTTMYRQTTAMPQPEQSQLRAELRKYAEATQGPEWGRQEFGHIHNAGRAAIAEMYRIVGRAQSGVASNPVHSPFVSELSTLASDRSARILDAKTRIPPLLWGSLIFGGFVLIGLTSFMWVPNNRAHLILASVIAVLIGLLMYLIYVLDHPFGPLGVTPQPFAHALVIFDLVDKGT